MAIASPVSDRLTVVALLFLTFATGLVDAISVLVLGHVFVANMTGHVIFLGFWFVPHSGVDLTAALVASVSAALAANSCAWAGDEAFDSPVPLPSLTTILSPARTRMRMRVT